MLLTNTLKEKNIKAKFQRLDAVDFLTPKSESQKMKYFIVLILTLAALEANGFARFRRNAKNECKYLVLECFC